MSYPDTLHKRAKGLLLQLYYGMNGDTRQSAYNLIREQDAFIQKLLQNPVVSVPAGAGKPEHAGTNVTELKPCAKS